MLFSKEIVSFPLWKRSHHRCVDDNSISFSVACRDARIDTIGLRSVGIFGKTLQFLGAEVKGVTSEKRF